jgi:3-hydroxybutyrate dehydrogenase
VIAKHFAGEGYNIVFNGLENDGREIATELADRHAINYIFSSANLLSPAAIKEMADSALSKFGRVDVLINNAGIQYVAPIEDFPKENGIKY